MLRIVPIALCLAAVPACYGSHGGAEGVADGGRDGGATRDASGDVDATVDESYCELSDGLRRCDFDRCPHERCTCYFNHVSERYGFCVEPPAGTEVSDCSSAAPCVAGLCMDLGNVAELGPPLLVGYCASISFCDALRRMEDPAICFYADGSAFETGAVPEASCPLDFGALCGPGCRDCPAGLECWGLSEASGLGVCVPEDDPTPCGAGDGLCPLDAGCLRFQSGPDAVLPPEEVAGVCVDESTCQSIADEYPGRFWCEPHS